MRSDTHNSGSLTETADVLFKLLRIALGGVSPEAGALKHIDWASLVDLATKQCVAAIANDGLEKCFKADPSLALPLDRDLKPVIYSWFGSTLNLEIKNENQRTAVSSLGALLSNAGLRTLVLKGFALAECYPVPEHRYASDFDCFLMMGTGLVTDRSAFEKGNRTLEDAGVIVDRSFYKHSSGMFKNVLVENHQFLVGWRGSVRWKRFELELERMLEAPDALHSLSNTDLLVGPPLFNALFFTRHAQVHFLIDNGILLRHVCDWAMFLRRYSPELDWHEFQTYCSRYGLSHFAQSMTRIAGFVCGISTPLGPHFKYSELYPADRRLLNDILSCVQCSSQPKSRVGKALRILRSGWKFRLFSDETSLGCLFRYIWGYFFAKDLMLLK